MNICKIHNIPLTVSHGWYGEKQECHQCLSEYLPQPQNLKYHKPLESNALERIKELENTFAPESKGRRIANRWGVELEDLDFLLKAFRVLHEIALIGKYTEAGHNDSHHEQVCGCYLNIAGIEIVDKEFEERMKDEKEKA